MRRAMTVLAALAVAGATAVTAPTAAGAARGTLVVDGKQHEDPNGCYASTRNPLTVTNFTDRLAYVYDDDKCEGSMVGFVQQGGTASFPFGSSVQVD
ncbi:hypothetical protein [Streptoalloteichus hindustanus]|uniref:Uncharacterized protein n=1 Tax=Streptoalloteichus hindustanus TaxID=2017 RepID=A0A1M5MHK9_STRHI|nr:hypothetical protein [Streptoalloteichus hindustanus]SHG76904.1 hypothetical protein SAMN05444320_113126 [Streptoalloteichus hindustanus]